MEKTPLLGRNAHEATTPQSTSSARRATGLAVLIAAFLLLLGHAWLEQPRRPSHHKSPDEADRIFEHLHSSEELQYHPCYQHEDVQFECARLLVPLDYFNQTTKSNISLAIIRLPAAVPPTDPRYGGAILFNPGGPGGSGVGFLQRAYKKLGEVITGAGDDQLYDFISFDPRGVGASEPKLQCFDSGLQSFIWEVRMMEEGILGSSNAAFGRLWSMVSAYAGSCSLSAIDHDDDIKKFVTTASVATDMLSIVEAHGRWREMQARRWPFAVSESLKHKPGKEKINYWGFSYGTYLGMTFASMYPDRINRLIVDGVVDAEDYKKALWFDNLVDTEKEMKTFYSYCANAGFPACALATQNSTSRDIEERVQNITDSLIHNPLPVVGPVAEVITFSDVKNLIFAALYSPIQSFPFVANLLVDLERGDGSTFAELLKPYHQVLGTGVSAGPLWGPLRNESTFSLGHAATMGIACSDGDSQEWATRDVLKEHWHRLAEISPTIGPMWAIFRMHCASYTVRPYYRFTGPFQGNTSHPVLFIGNSADPVTPVRNARKMSKGFVDSRVLEQKSDGHCSSAARSKCTSDIIYRYFQTGELPAKDAVCDVDELPFGASQTDPYPLSDLHMYGHLRPLI